MTSIPDLDYEDHIKYYRRKNTDGFKLRYALGHSERKELIRELGVHALVLFEYYLRLASTENAPITDQATADYFDWSPTTAKRHRLSLSQKGWIASEKFRLKNGRRMIVHYLGKAEVEAAGRNPKGEAKVIKKKKETNAQSLFILPSKAEV